MPNHVNRLDPSIVRPSSNEADYSEEEWIRNPPSFDSLYGTVEPQYWKLDNVDPNLATDVVEMTAQEKANVDALRDAADLAEVKARLLSQVDETSGVDVRALIQLSNRRDNYLVARIAELQDALLAIKATSGGTANIRNAIPASFLRTKVRDLRSSIQSYKDDISNGDAD